MAASLTTTSNYEVIRRVFSDDIFEWFLNSNAEFWTKTLKSAKLVANPIGSGYFWPFRLQSAQNIGTPAQDANTPTTKAGTVVQGNVTLAQFIGAIEVSLILEAVGQGTGAWKSVVKDEMTSNLMDLTKHVNRIYAGTHGTGRLFVVNATVTSTACVGKLPIGVLNVRPKMRVEQYTTDTSGSIVGTAFTIDKIVQSTRTITMGASQTATANQGFYLEGAYGNAPNGIAGLVDDGNNLTTLHGISRSTYEELKSTVNGNSGTVRDLSEDLLINAALDTRQASGESVDVLLMNTGQLAKYLAITRPDRRIPTSTGAMNSDTGYKDEIAFVYDGKRCNVEVSEDVSPRTVYGLSTSQLRRVGDNKLSWLDWGGGPFVQGVNSTGYKTTKQATLKFFSNLATYKPNAHFRIDDLADAQLCGLTRGGTDV